MVINNKAGEEVTRVTIIIPCYNERPTLQRCVDRVLKIVDDHLSLEIIIVDDASTDGSSQIAREMAIKHPEIKVFYHEYNQGKGAALRTGFQNATGEFVAVQDADLEYNPTDLKRLLVPLINDEADVVFGSRFLHSGAHRVLYFWHYLGNRFLTLISNMFTDLNVTDMETCYKVFRRDVIQDIQINENRFGFEPEIVAKVAQMRLRIFEMGISYYGRTYAEGKKINIQDGFRAIYCILRYNAHRAPIAIQFFLYILIGGVAAVANLLAFLALISFGLSVTISAPVAFITAAAMNYVLCLIILFRHKARWNSMTEVLIYVLVVSTVCVLDLGITKTLIASGIVPAASKLVASLAGLILNFLGRRLFVFPEPPPGSWKPETIISRND